MKPGLEEFFVKLTGIYMKYTYTTFIIMSRNLHHGYVCKYACKQETIVR